ncbi:GDP-mannose-dependent alpha-(1-6)-phosphatidylinositol monomannoside mannosyltransferase [Corynebacterium occultum]|uniref:GDP-mannose-dependent alpha-(1-6)-phosphatidylinositol monomannoside mannosyltransferase n=1 Tax=Corynebacterium occultum TaxID=2675219 RepID=A0A6B8W4L7_9CORY|nr:glycosyltransferase family 4 protein [Corynebacterium occultum]QGU08504.1 GDP-mannose-dependent alpha-(1-6)-phosphatidylinositol monomannoside mannosyltransferase [Corynebacterium occultum]
MKILLLCWRDSTHPQGGGSERYLERVGEYLARQGHEVVYRTAGHTDSPRRSMREGVRYSRSGGKFTVYPKAWLGILAGHLGFGTLKGFDAVVDTQNGIPFFARPLFPHIPTILLTHHCHREQWPVAGPAVAKLGWFLEKQVAPRIYRGAPYVTVSQPSAEELVELRIRERDIHIIRNGIDPIPAHLPRLEQTDATHLATLSRLVPHKQIEDAMDVIRRLGESHNLILDVIGSGWWSDELHEYADHTGVTERIHFHGQVTEDYKHALLARAELHLMPSRKEGWGLAVIEAAQHGVPTIGYRSAGGLRDSIKHNSTGLLVDNPAELITATEELLTDASRRRALGSAARDLAAGYSWEDTGQRFAELLEEITGS